MFSEMIREALKRKVVGQPDAVNSVARGVTRIVSKLTPSERSWCAYLLIGPHGTGRTHLVRSLSSIAQGGAQMITVNCKVGVQVDPWADFLRHLEPLLTNPTPPLPPWLPQASTATWDDAPRPLRLVLVQDLERAHKDLFPQLAYLLESGQEVLPGGRCLRIDGCMFFFTSGLCSDEILDQSRIGFSGTTHEADEEGQDALNKICHEKAANAFGTDLLGQLDDLIVFRRLDDELLAETLDRHFARMNGWLSTKGIRCELMPAAKEFLLSSASHEPLKGATDLMRVHRNEVEFPLADLLVSRALEPGCLVRVDHKTGDMHLHFSVEAGEEAAPTPSAAVREVPIGA